MIHVYFTTYLYIIVLCWHCVDSCTLENGSVDSGGIWRVDECGRDLVSDHIDDNIGSLVTCEGRGALIRHLNLQLKS